MSRESQLLKNTSIIAIGQLSSKMFAFFLLPLYTSKLTTSDFGTIDVLQSFISLSLYFVTLQVESAVFRFLIESKNNENQKKEVFSSAFLMIIVINIGFTLCTIILNIIMTIPHVFLFVLGFWGVSLSTVMLNTARGLGHNTLYSFSSFLMTVISLLINIILILGLKIGGESILIALAISNLAGASIVMFKEKIWKLLKVSYFNIKLLKEMLSYSIPLVPNAISWWISNSSDRFIVACFLGNSSNGIYAAANKIPTIYTTIFNVFNLAWTESVALNINDQDREVFINKIINTCYKLFSFVALGIICFIGLTFDLLIGSNYANAYNHILILVIAIFINSMCSLYGGIFTAFKASKIVGLSTIGGAVANILINLILIRPMGLYAASISTLFSYIVIFFTRSLMLKKYITVKVSKSFIIQLSIISSIVSFCYLSNDYVYILYALFLTIFWGIMNNHKIITDILKQVKLRVHAK